MEVWAWEGKCCLAVRVVTSSVRSTLETLASPISLKIISVILLDLGTSGLGRSSAGHNRTSWSTTRHCQAHYTPLLHDRVKSRRAKTNEMRPEELYKKQVSPPFSGEKLAQSSSFIFSYFDSHRLCETLFAYTWSVHMLMHLAQDLSLSWLFIVSTHTVIWPSLWLFPWLVPLPLSLSSSLLVHPYILIFNFSFAESLFSSWLLYCSFCCCYLKLVVTGFRLTQWSHKTSTVAAFPLISLSIVFSDLLMELMCFPSCPIGTSITQAVEVFSAGTKRKLLSIGIKRSVTESEDRRGDFTPGRKKILWDYCSFPPPDQVSQNCQY